MAEKFKSFLNKTRSRLGTDITTVFVVLACVFAVFCTYRITPRIIAATAVAVMFSKTVFKNIWKYALTYFAFAFLLISILSAYFHDNKKGIMFSLCFLFISLISFYLRQKMTRELFEVMLNVICLACLYITVMCVLEKFSNSNNPNYRCELWFKNSNYLGALLAGCVIVCAYKVVTKKGSDFYYYIIASACGVCMYFCGSIFAFLEVLTAVSLLLILTKKHRLLSYFFIVCVICGVCIIFIPDFFPRISESNATLYNRFAIWKDTLGYIPQNLFFGKGFFAYETMPDISYKTSHSHNLFLEAILNFGIIGTIILIICFYLFYKSVFKCTRSLKKNRISILIIAMSVGVFVHSMTDLTMIWTQTALFYAIIMSGIGADERRLFALQKSI